MVRDNFEKFSKYDRFINFKTKDRADITTLFENPDALRSLIKDMSRPFKNKKIDKIACTDALGFILGTGVSLELKKPLILIRKHGKLPYPEKNLLSMDTGGPKKSRRKLQIKKDSIKKRDKILIVDDWLNTGIQVKTAIKMIEKLGGKVIGITTFSSNTNDSTKYLFENYNLKQVRKIL